MKSLGLAGELISKNLKFNYNQLNIYNVFWNSQDAIYVKYSTVFILIHPSRPGFLFK